MLDDLQNGRWSIFLISPEDLELLPYIALINGSSRKSGVQEPQCSEASYSKVVGPKDHIIYGFWAIFEP